MKYYKILDGIYTIRTPEGKRKCCSCGAIMNTNGSVIRHFRKYHTVIYETKVKGIRSREFSFTPDWGTLPPSSIPFTINSNIIEASSFSSWIQPYTTSGGSSVNTTNG